MLNVANVPALDQPAADIITFRERPLALQFDVDAARLVCAVYSEVLIPADLSHFNPTSNCLFRNGFKGSDVTKELL